MDEDELAMSEACATIIQAIYRGHKARVNYAIKKGEAVKKMEEDDDDNNEDDKNEDDSDLKEAITVILQSIVRGFLSRRRFAILLQTEKEKRLTIL